MTDTGFEDRLRQRLHSTAGTVDGDGLDLQAVRDDAAGRRDVAPRRWRRAPVVLAAVAAATIVVVAVVTRDDPTGRTRTDDPPGPVATEPTTRRPSDTTASTPSTSEPGVSPSTTATTTATTPPSGSTATSSSATTAPGSDASDDGDLPAAAIPSNGDVVWTVYLAVIPPDSGGSQHPDMDAAVAAADRLGYRASTTPVGCHVGGAAALGVTDDHWAATVDFWQQAEAEQVRTAFEADGRHVVAVTRTEAQCLDVGASAD